MILVANTSFPQFQFDEANKFVPSPDLDDTSISGHDSIEDDDVVERTVKKRFEQFKSKEDQDVAVFMNIANKMDLSSLIFILQGHAKTQNLPVSAQVAAAAKISGKDAKAKVDKNFRFATANNDMVKCVYHVVESVKDCQDMWWTDAEMKQIRGAAIQDVKYYRKYRADYKQTVEILANAGVQEGVFTPQTIEANLKKLMEDSYARGLEVHIVNLLSDLRRETVRAVLEEQAECRMCGDTSDITAESLREQSMAYTIQSRTFALKLAQCDQVEALKASISNKWEADEMSQGSKESAKQA